MPQADVVIPLYNKAKYIRRCLDSVRLQTAPPRSVIVVDDGSTDSGPAVVDSLGMPGLQLLKQPRRGASAARNAGIRASSSEWVALLDADDAWDARFLEKTLAVAEVHPEVVAVTTNMIMFSEGRQSLRLGDVPARGGIVDDYFAASLTCGAIIHSSSVVARRRMLVEAGLFPVGIEMGEDLDTWLRLAWLGPVAYCPDPLAFYYLDNAENTVKKSRAKGKGYPATAYSFLRWRRARRIPRHLLATSGAYVLRLLCVYAQRVQRQGDYFLALRTLVWGVWLVPYGPRMYAKHFYALTVRSARRKLRNWFHNMRHDR